MNDLFCVGVNVSEYGSFVRLAPCIGGRFSVVVV